MLRERFKLAGITLSRTLRSAGMGESIVDELVSELEKLSNPNRGTGRHPGQVDIRITAKPPAARKPKHSSSRSRNRCAACWAVNIYGADEDTLPSVLTKLNRRLRYSLDVLYTPALEEIVA
jgi:nicotinamide-nucleotide amidase